MESSRKFSSFSDVFLSSISANAVAPLFPTGLSFRFNSCSVLFVHRALANWHAPSELMLHCSRLSSTRVQFVLSTEASEMVFWREKQLLLIYSFVSEKLWWMISSIASGARSLPLMPSHLRLVDEDSSLLRAWQSSIPIPVLVKSITSRVWAAWVSDVTRGTVPPEPILGLSDKSSTFRCGTCGIRWARSSQNSEVK